MDTFRDQLCISIAKKSDVEADISGENQEKARFDGQFLLENAVKSVGMVV